LIFLRKIKWAIVVPIYITSEDALATRGEYTLQGDDEVDAEIGLHD
jgi:hypothetical protein